MVLVLWFTRINLASLSFVFHFCLCKDDGLFFCLVKSISLAGGHVPSSDEKSPSAETTSPVAAATAYMEMSPVPKWDPVLYGQKIWVLLKWSMTNLEKGWMPQGLSARGLDWATDLLAQSCCHTCLHGNLIRMSLSLMRFQYTMLHLGNRWKKEEKSLKIHSGFISRLNVCVYTPASSHELGV